MELYCSLILNSGHTCTDRWETKRRARQCTRESTLGYHSCVTGVLTWYREQVRGECQVGSLTGAVASQRVTEAPKGTLRLDGNQSTSAIAEACLTVRLTSRTGTKKSGIVIRRCRMEGPSLNG